MNNAQNGLIYEIWANGQTHVGQIGCASVKRLNEYG